VAYLSSCEASALARAVRLFRRYQQDRPRRVERRPADRLMPPVLVDLGELRGLIYRSDRGPARKASTYVHFFDRPPRLTADPDGRRLFIMGGCYRVTRRGIEG
jgi:hypothetical protein